MKRRITIEVDDSVWRAHEDRRKADKLPVRIGEWLAMLLGPMRKDRQRMDGKSYCEQYGVTLISDEQVD